MAMSSSGFGGWTKGGTVSKSVYNWKTMSDAELQKVASGQTQWGSGAFSQGAQAELDSRASTKQASAAQSSYSDLMAKMQAEQDAAKAANLKRYQQGLDLYSQIEQMYAPGNAMETAGMKQIETTKNQDLARAMQSAVSSGMGKTTRAAFSGARWEAEVGQQARLNLESLLTDKRATAMANKAGFIERREDTGPSYDTIAQLAMQAGTYPTSSTPAAKKSVAGAF